MHDGVLPTAEARPLDVRLAADWRTHFRSQLAERAEGLELVFAPDPTIYDGRFANNGWLQELPKPMTKLTWGNAALMSPADGRRAWPGAGELCPRRRAWRLLHDRCVELPLGERRVAAAVLDHARDMPTGR